MSYEPDAKRYDGAHFRRSGRSGIVLPPISLGLWQNFGGGNVFETGRAVVRRAFDRGVTHFDLANNYGPLYGSAEENFGEILRKDFRSLRNELLISTKAGWDMWPGPYGEGGSRKYMLASWTKAWSAWASNTSTSFTPTGRPWMFHWKRP
jgi:L-glyceraldehyde 3-phosphate reductase